MIFPKRVDTSLEGRLDDIERAFDADAYLSAISLALTIPDICGDRLYPECKKATRRRYVDWFNQYVAPNYPEEPTGEDEGTARKYYFDGDDCYQLRCVYLHQGINATDPINRKTVYSMIQFRIFKAGPGCDHIGLNIDETTGKTIRQVDLDLRKFIRCLKAGAERFLEEHPEMNADNGSASFLYGPVLDFENGRELP